jgi:hypothetical protein
LTVRDPAGTTVFSHEHPARQLPASGLRSESAQQRLTAAPLGTYTVQAELLGAQRQVLAQAATQYQVVTAASHALPTPGAQAIPGLNDWAMAVLAACLALGGAAGMRCRKGGRP